MSHPNKNSIDVYHMMFFSTEMLVSLIGHVEVSTMSNDVVTSLFQQLCGCNDDIQSVISCIHSFARRIPSLSRRIAIMSAGLESCPCAPIRNALFDNGARLDPDNALYYHIAAGLGMYHVIYGVDATVLVHIDTELSVHESLMEYAVRSGDINVVKFLIDCGVRTTLTSLATALEIGNCAITDTIYSHLDVTHSDPRTYHDWWSMVRTTSSAEWLLDHGFRSDVAIYGCCRPDRLDLVEFLIEKRGLEVPSDIILRLMWTFPDVEMLDYLLAHGADLHVRDDSGHTLSQAYPLYERYFTDKGIYDLLL